MEVNLFAVSCDNNLRANISFSDILPDFNESYVNKELSVVESQIIETDLSIGDVAIDLTDASSQNIIVGSADLLNGEFSMESQNMDPWNAGTCGLLNPQENDQKGAEEDLSGGSPPTRGGKGIKRGKPPTRDGKSIKRGNPSTREGKGIRRGKPLTMGSMGIKRGKRPTRKRKGIKRGTPPTRAGNSIKRGERYGEQGIERLPPAPKGSFTRWPRRIQRMFDPERADKDRLKNNGDCVNYRKRRTAKLKDADEIIMGLREEIAELNDARGASFHDVE